jgi:hypothetical protein
MNRPLAHLLLNLLPLAVLSAAQQPPPLLRVTVARLAGQPGLAIVAHNSYSSPAVEYVVADRYYNPFDHRNRCPPDDKDQSGRCVTLISHVVKLPHPTLPPNPDRLDVPAGGSLQIGGYGSPKTRVVSDTCVAVIYADGAMAGAPSVLNQLLFERGRNLIDLRRDVRILRRLEANPATDWASVAAMFQRRARRHDRMLYLTRNGGAAGSPVFGDPIDKICRYIARSLRAGEPPAPLLHYLGLEIAQLEASKPPIRLPGGR